MLVRDMGHEQIHLAMEVIVRLTYHRIFSFLQVSFPQTVMLRRVSRELFRPPPSPI